MHDQSTAPSPAHSLPIDADSPTEAVAAWAAARRLPAEVVGAWVWITFDAKPDTATRAALKAAGFHWNRKRGCWQHACGVRRRFSARTNPRFTYGAVPVDADAAFLQDAEARMDAAYAGERL